MSSTPLPRQVDIRKLIAADTIISAQEPLRNFARLLDMLEARDGDVEVNLHFYRREQGGKFIDGEVRAIVAVLCQRCMKPMPLAIDSTFSVGVVWTDEQAIRLPKDLEPYIVGDELQDVRDLIEDELILCVPYSSYHEQLDCADNYVQPELPDTPVESKPNPFQVLEQLKSGK
ncbi:MAG: hypothetical protein JWM78_2215 [Verrucomicrobiaceae bacterium]|nr:hypothetical protein [Verrucomicrobiaceae bacterium]